MCVCVCVCVRGNNTGLGPSADLAACVFWKHRVAFDLLSVLFVSFPTRNVREKGHGLPCVY